ncbi:hypothetical protein Plec18167_006148 [Paecilomyces lecythidis]|uniref:Protein kinase domain-containing protein n=1 Tax=Paecilomyces lecythidis TaxID=3004212 RepID=A0ABR3XCJ5_9EURO
MAQDVNSLLERLRRAEKQVDEERRLREQEQRLREQEQHDRQQERRLREREQRHREQAERQLERSNLLGLLEGCHELSLAIKIETDATLTTQGDTSNPVNRKRPERLVPWNEFPSLQEAVWETFHEESVFISQNLFASRHQLQLIQQDIQAIRSELDLRFFERDTVDRFVRSILNEVGKNDRLRRQFKLRGDVTFESHANMSDITSSLEDTMEQLTISESQPAATPKRTQTRRQPTRRRNRRADQFCVHVISNEQRVPVYAVEYKAPHKLSLPEILVGLREVDIKRDVIDKDGDDFEYHATRLVTAVVTQLFSYMVDIGVRDGIVCTGEALICLHIPEDPSIVQYYLLVPNRDVIEDDPYRLHRTAVAQVLAFTLNAVQAEPPSQSWYDAADQLDTWEVEYLNILQQIPESVRKEPPSSEYKPTFWKPINRSPYRLRSRCQPAVEKSHDSRSDDDEDDEASAPPSPSPARARPSGKTRGRSDRGRASSGYGGRRGNRKGTGKTNSNGTRNEFCTMKCLYGLVNGGPLDLSCPNADEHGYQVHGLRADDFMRLLSDQLSHDREYGFEQLHIKGRTGFLLKATLLSHGYTVIIKATDHDHLPNLGQEIKIYHHLRLLQGNEIPICIGDFAPQVRYWYHGKLMMHMLVLSWAGVRATRVMTEQTRPLLDQQRTRILSHMARLGVVHKDSAWRNVLWNEEIQRIVMIDFEEPSQRRPHGSEMEVVAPVSCRSPLGASSGNVIKYRRINPTRPRGQKV